MSEIRSILLHADATAESATRLAVARDLARRLEADLTAVFGASPETDGMAFAYSAAAAIGELASGREALTHDLARARLQGRASDERTPTLWCDIVGDSITHGFLEEAVYADLLVVGQEAGPAEAGGAPPGFTESVILDSGKPTLVVPRELRSERVGAQVLVAWNGSAQAARALAGALPLLHRAGQVHVAMWSPRPLAAPYSRLAVAEFLRRHGIDSTLHLRPPSAQVGRELTALAQELRADLVVMGCYGRSRAAERLLGGVTRSLLTALPVPVLMAH